MRSNSILSFIEKLHRFERENELFELIDHDGRRYWDIVRLEVFLLLYRQAFPAPPAAPHPLQQETAIKKMVKIIGLAWWMLVNDLNYYLKAKKVDWVVLKVSRFVHPVTKRPSDAVMDEIQDELPAKETMIIESFNNPVFGNIRVGSPFFSYKLWHLKKVKLQSRSKPVRNYRLSDVLKANFTTDINWDNVITDELIKYDIDYRFARKLFSRTKPRAFLYSGHQKGLVKAANELGIATVEVQHSPLNSADITYSYNKEIDYSQVDTLPRFFLVNSDKWEKQIFFPATLVEVGSDYFNASAHLSAPAEPDHLLVISEPANFDYLLNFTLRLVSENKISCNVIFKLHSADLDRLPRAKEAFKNFPQVKVIFNERSMSELLAISFAVVLIYSTVAYQAIQMGRAVIILKTGYYEGGYDIFDLPNVRLIGESAELSDTFIQKLRGEEFPPYHFFDALDRTRLHQFLDTLKSSQS